MSVNRESAPMHAPYDIRADGIGRIRYAPNHLTAAAQLAFLQFQLTVLERGTDAGKSCLAAHLIAFEAVVAAEDLIAALGAVPGCYRWADTFHLDWNRQGEWRDRRALGSATRTVLARDGLKGAEWDPPSLAAFAAEAVPRWAGYPDAEIIARLLGAAKAWSVTHLPGMLAAHVLGDAPLQPLPASALAREESRLALQSSVATLGTEFGSTQALCLDVGLAGAPGSDYSLTEQLRKACAVGKIKGHSHAALRTRIIRAIEPLAATATYWVDALLIGWALHLLQVGTRHTTPMAPGTVANYVSAFSRPLAARLAQEVQLPRSSEEWTKIYKDIFQGEIGNSGDASSAKLSFHDYVILTFGVDPVPTSQEPKAKRKPPAANTIWPHEFALAQEWLARADGDERLISTLSLVLRLAQTVRLRTWEVLSLRLRNVVPSTAEIEVYPRDKDGPGKSKSAARKLPIDPETRQQLQAWITRRRAEGADNDHLLFGDPYQPRSRPYRESATLTSLIMILRHVTGDPDVVFHTTSHAWITRTVGEMNASEYDADVDPLDLCAEASGHFSAVTLHHYLHEYSGWLRSSVDAAVERSVNVTANVASRYTGVSAAALRQQKSRRQPDRNGYWHAICGAAPALDAPSVSSLHSLAHATPPAVLNCPPHRNPENVARVLEDLSTGRSLDAVILRSGCTEEDVRRIAMRALQTLRLVEAWKPGKRLLRITAESSLIHFDVWRQGTQCAPAFDLRRREQDKYSAIRAHLPAPRSLEWCAWVEGYQDGFLALSVESAAPLFRWLANCEVSSLRLAISTEGSSAESPELHDLERIFEIAFGIPPRVFTHASGEGRPRFYLLWSASTIGEQRPAPAATSLAGLHAWMLCASCLGGPALLDASIPEDWT